jgi:hypothetical protein
MWALLWVGVLVTGSDPVSLGAQALKSAQQNALVAEAAATETSSDQVEAETMQQLVIAQGAESAASGSYDTSRPYVPESKKAVTEAEIAARKAKEQAARAAEAEAAMKQVAGDAAEQAGVLVMDMIKKEAADEAKKSADESKAWPAKKAAATAGNAAAAMEPFHLMMLREQKISAIDYENAKKAMAAAKDLNGKGQKMAADAQALQAAGLIYQANQLMQEAHGTMSGAQSLQENAKKLYASASAAGGRAGYYVYAAQQAAAAAVSGTLFNKPPAYPSFLQKPEAASPQTVQAAA